MEADTSGEIALPLGLPELARRCWYCGTTQALIFEREHQRPRSRGGAGGPVVLSCRFHNRLKGDRTVEEFRQALAERLGMEASAVVFAGEASAARPATALEGIESLVDDRDAVRLLPEAGRALRRAVVALRSRGLPRVNLTSLASRYISEGIARDAERFRGDRLFELAGDDWELPEPAPEDTVELNPAKAALPRRVVRIDSRLHESLIAAVLFLRTRGRPGLGLVDAVDAAAAAWIASIQATTTKVGRYRRRPPTTPPSWRRSGSISTPTPIIDLTRPVELKSHEIRAGEGPWPRARRAAR